jgi:hypothetical protein
MNCSADLNTAVKQMRGPFLKTATCLFAVAVLAGCSKKEKGTEAAAPNEAPAEASAPAAPTARAAAQPASSTPEVEALPGQNAVRSALKAKNYSGAVTQLLAIKNGLPAEMWTTYTDFYSEVRNTLIEEGQKDPNAAQALMMLRAGTAGR